VSRERARPVYLCGQTALIPAALLVAISACGGGGGKTPSSSASAHGQKTGAQVATGAAAALKAAGSVHVVGTVSGTNLDIRAQTDGGTGTLTKDGAQASAISLPEGFYIKGTVGFYMKDFGVSAADARQVSGHWVKAQADASDTQTFSLGSYADLVSRAGAGSTVEAGTFHGLKALVVSRPDGAKEYVAAAGTPYPLALTIPAGTQAATITFTDFGKRVSLAVPKGAIDGTSTAVAG
jgi:hypothetical protein